MFCERSWFLPRAARHALSRGPLYLHAVMSDTGVSATWKNAAIRIALKGGCNVMAFPAGCISAGANGLSQLSPPDRPDPSAAAAMPASGEGAARLSAGATPFTAAEGSGQGSWMA